MPVRTLWRRHPTAVTGVACLVVLLVASQLLLPLIAVRVVRSRIGDPQAEVTVRAFPALKMALGHVDRLTVRARTIGSGEAALTERLKQASKVGTIDAQIETIPLDQLTLHDVRSEVHDGAVVASAAVDVAELAQMAPGGKLEALPTQADGRPRFQAQVSAFGFSANVPLVVVARNGQVEVAPDLPIAGAFRISVFRNDELQIEDVTSTVDGDRIRLNVTGRLR